MSFSGFSKSHPVDAMICFMYIERDDLQYIAKKAFAWQIDSINNRDENKWQKYLSLLRSSWPKASLYFDYEDNVFDKVFATGKTGNDARQLLSQH